MPLKRESRKKTLEKNKRKSQDESKKRCQDNIYIYIYIYISHGLEQVRRLSEIFFQDDNYRTPEKSKSRGNLDN